MNIIQYILCKVIEILSLFVVKQEQAPCVSGPNTYVLPHRAHIRNRVIDSHVSQLINIIGRGILKEESQGNNTYTLLHNIKYTEEYYNMIESRLSIALFESGYKYDLLHDKDKSVLNITVTWE